MKKLHLVPKHQGPDPKIGATTRVSVCALVPAIRESLELTAGKQIHLLREAKSPAEIIAHIPEAG